MTTPVRTILAAAVFALLSIPPARAIINGKPMTGSEDYAHAVVGVVPSDKYDRPGACTGILITPRAVLTAAPCVSGDVKSVAVVVDLKIGDAHKVAVTKTVILPFDTSEDFTNGQQFVFAGYGRAVSNRSRSTGTARKASIAAAGYDTPREVALKPLMDAWPCDGDSGGPIMRKDMSGRYALTGIMNAVSAGPVGECLFEHSFMTPLHTYRDWIAETLAKGG